MAAPDAGYDPVWNQVGRFAGYFAGVALLVIVALRLADGFGVLGSAPAYKSTSAPAVPVDRFLATLLVLDIVASSASVASVGDATLRDLLDEHYRVARQKLDRHRGVEVD